MIRSCFCFYVPAAISLSSAREDQTPLHSCYIYSVHQWNPVKALYGFDSYSLPPRQRHKKEREQTIFFHLDSRRSCSTQVTAGEMFFSVRWDSQENIINVLLHPRGFYVCSHFFFLHFQFIFRFDKTTAK